MLQNTWDDPYAPTARGGRNPLAGITQPTSPDLNWGDDMTPTNAPHTGPANASPGPAASAPASPTSPQAAAPSPGEAIVRSMGVAPLGAWSAPAPAKGPDYSALLSTAGTPNGQDALARSVASNLTQAGHEVVWNEDGSLSVDGRPYTVNSLAGNGEPPSTAPHGAVPPTQQPNQAATGGQAYDFGDPVYNAIGALFVKYGHTPTLSDVSQWGKDIDAHYMAAIEAKIREQFGPGGPQSGPNGTSPNHGTTPAGYSYEGFLAELRALPPNGDSVRQVVAAHPEWGIQVLNAKGDKVRLPDGRVKDIGYSFGDPAHAAWQDLDVTEGGGGAPAPGGGPGGSTPGLDALWQHVHGLQSRPGYAASSSPELDAFIKELLGNPESMSPEMVAKQKAANDEEEASAALNADQALQRFGWAGGIQDSNWLASERASTARSADQGIITGRRQIEQKAAETNKADRRAAAAIGINKVQLDNTIRAQAEQLGISRDQLIASILDHIATLEQNDRQFGSDLGYRYDALNSSNDNNYWDDVTH